MASHSHPTRAQIESGQLEKLRALVAAMLPTNKFYAHKFAGVDVFAATRSLEAFRIHVPFTTKQELVADQAAHPPFGTALTFPLERYVRFNQTSATTAAPLRWLDTMESWSWMLDCWMQVLAAANVTTRDCVYFAFSFGPFLGFWTAFDAGQRLGCLCIPGGGLSSAARLKAIIDNGATVLCCTPTYALHLAQVAAEERIDLSRSRVRAIIVAGEPGGAVEATRQRISQGWNGARVWDHHGMTEIGPVSFECPANPGTLHVIESGYIPEVIDPRSLKALPDGEIGELVLTNLGRPGSPLLRYRTGDLVCRAPRLVCGCGRSDAALVGGIRGRADDMVVVRGVKVHPTAVEEIVRREMDVVEYRVEFQTAAALTQMTLIIEPGSDCSDPTGLIERLETAFQTSMALRVGVKLVAPGTLERFEMKARRWIRK